MAKLVDFHKAQGGHEVHEGGIELKVLRGGTDMVTSTEDALENHGKAHGIEETKVLRQSIVNVVKIGFLLPSGQEIEVLSSAIPSQEDKEDPESQVPESGTGLIASIAMSKVSLPNIGVDVVKVPDRGSWDGAQKVVVTEILEQGDDHDHAT